jgi:DNA-directed RNA polymerase specialized sigma24 family protein
MENLYFTKLPLERLKSGYALLRTLFKAPSSLEFSPEQVAEAYGIVLAAFRNQFRWLCGSGQDCGFTDEDLEEMLDDAVLRLKDHCCKNSTDYCHPAALFERIAKSIFVDACRRKGAIKRGGDAIVLSFDPQWKSSGDSRMIALGMEVEQQATEALDGECSASLVVSDVQAGLQRLVSQQQISQQEADIYHLFRLEEADWQSIALGYKCCKDTVYRTVKKVDCLLRPLL